MGRRPKSPKPPTPIAPPPPVEQVDAEFIAPTMRQLSARRARRGSYITGTERRLGGKPRVSGKEASAIAEKTVKEIDPLKGFEAPEGANVLEAKAKFIQKEADAAGVEELKGFESFKRKRYATKGSIRSRQIREDKTKYSKYLADYLDAAQSRIKSQYRTTQLRNLGLM
jgi:hypothetical protein